MQKRKALMIDAELAEEMKRVAERYGMSLASYLRALFRSAIKAEELNIYAPRALQLAITIKKLYAMGFAPVPIELLRYCRDSEALRGVGYKVGMLLRSLGFAASEALELFTSALSTVVFEEGRLALLPSEDEGVRSLYEVIQGVAEAFGLRSARKEESGVIVIELAERRPHRE